MSMQWKEVKHISYMAQAWMVFFLFYFILCLTFLIGLCLFIYLFDIFAIKFHPTTNRESEQKYILMKDMIMCMT